MLHCLAKGSFALLPQSSTGATAWNLHCRLDLMQFPRELHSTSVCTPCIMTRGGGKMLSTSSLKGGLGTRLGVIGVEGWHICPLGQGPACALGSSLLVLHLLNRLCDDNMLLQLLLHMMLLPLTNCCPGYLSWLSCGCLSCPYPVHVSMC